MLALKANESDIDWPLTKALSTLIRIFLKTHLSLSVFGSHAHEDGVFGHQNKSFRKGSLEWIIWKTPFYCYRVHL